MLNIVAIIEQCKRGDRKAQKELYARFAPRLLTLCRRYAHDEEQAKDFLQDSFIRIFEKLHTIKNDSKSVNAWMHTVCRNMIFNHFRKKRIALSELDVENSMRLVQDEWQKTDQSVLEERVLAILQRLPDRHRIVINLHIIEGKSHEEIANTLGITNSSSRSQLSRALKKLKEQFELSSNKSLYYENGWI